MNNDSSTLTPSHPGSMQHYPGTPSYVVALSVVAAAIVTVFLLSVLYYCLAEKARRRARTTDQSPCRETERLREESALEHEPDVQLSDNYANFAVEKPKPSPSIFSRGDFLLEVLDGVENISNFSQEDLAGEVGGGTIQNIESDRVIVAMDDLEDTMANNEESTNTLLRPETLTTPPRESASMAMFLDNLATPKLASCMATSPSSDCVWNCSTMGLQVRKQCQADASTAGLRGSFSSDLGSFGGEGGVVVACEKYEIYEDPLDKLEEIGDMTEQYISRIVSDVVSTAAERLFYSDFVSEHEHSLSSQCDMDNGQLGDDNDSPHETIENIFSIENENFVHIGGIELHENKEENLERASLVEVDQEYSLVQNQGRVDDASSTPAQSIPVHIIPISDQKYRIPNSTSAALSCSTPSLLHPPVSILGLPLTERAVSVSHLSLNRSGMYLPNTPMSGTSEYSPVYNMRFGSSKRLSDLPRKKDEQEVVVLEDKQCDGQNY